MRLIVVHRHKARIAASGEAHSAAASFEQCDQRAIVGDEREQHPLDVGREAALAEQPCCQGSREVPRCDHGFSPRVIAGRSARPDRLGLINLNGTIVAPRPNRPWRSGH
ncbi:MAG TPA: hypothetical protein VKV27_12240 [Solirubrobacteraceae bacterium]|nr:hypothetical protein [Solirubrobacteraceae bacterium]